MNLLPRKEPRLPAFLPFGSILAATSTNTYSSYTHTSESGFMSNGGLSFTYGNRETTDKQDSSNTLQSQNRSMVGSTNGNLTLKAGGNALISGSDIIAAPLRQAQGDRGDINIIARDITINSGLDKSTSHQEHDSKQSGLTIAVTNSAVSAAQTGEQMAQLGGQSKDPRIKALAAAATALAVANASANATEVSVSATVGSSESHSDSTQTSSRTSGSTLKAGGNLNLVATAEKGEGGREKGGNITIQGSDIKAGRDITLDASNNINLLADQSTASQVSHNSSSSSGAGIVASTGQKGFGFTANAAGARGNADGFDVTYTNTHLDAGNTLHIKSGGDTNLKGAVANGRQITADIGGNLNIESLQDTSTYASKQESYSASGTIGPKPGASLSLSQSKISGNYASVKEQSGLKAGNGGFQIAVKGNTDLKGGVIESTQAATDNHKNTLSTATLTSSDIQNRSEYDAQSISISAGSGGPGMPIVLGAGDTITSVTRSGISGASITITDDKKQQTLTGKDGKETVASLNREVATEKDTSGAIANNLDVNEVQTAMTVTQTFAQQANTFVATQAQKSDKLKAEGEAKQKEAATETDPARKEQLLAESKNLKQQAADTKDESDKWGASGTYGRIATALTAAAGGNVTGGTSQLIQGAAVNYIQSLGAEQVKHIADTLLDDKGKDTAASTAVRAALHAIVACTGASAQGSDCGSAALGASAGSIINTIMAGDPKSMTAAEKENRKNLVASLVMGIAATTDASNIAVATSAAVMETENNYLKTKANFPKLSEREQYDAAKAACSPSNPAACKTQRELEKTSLDRDNKIAKDCNGGSGENCTTGLHTAIDNGSHVAQTADGKMYVVSPESHPSLTESNSQSPGLLAAKEQAQWQADIGQPVLATGLLASGVARTAVGVLEAAVITTQAVKLGSGTIGASVNAYVQLKSDPNNSINKTEVGMAFVTSYLTAGATIVPSVVVNTEGALIASTLKGENPNASMASAAVGSLFGYPAGRFAEVGASGALQANVLKNTNLFAGAGASNTVPVFAGAFISSLTQEVIGNTVKNALQSGAAK